MNNEINKLIETAEKDLIENRDFEKEMSDLIELIYGKEGDKFADFLTKLKKEVRLTALKEARDSYDKRFKEFVEKLKKEIKNKLNNSMDTDYEYLEELIRFIDNLANPSEVKDANCKV